MILPMSDSIAAFHPAVNAARIRPNIASFTFSHRSSSKNPDNA